MLFGKGNKVIWQHNPALGMPPAHQRLDADERPVLQGEERLIEQEQLLSSMARLSSVWRTLATVPTRWTERYTR